MATQSTGTAAETLSAAATAGFLGWSPETDRTVYTMAGGNDRSAYADNTAYAVGDSVTYQGERYVAVATVASNNTVKPIVGAVWRLASDKKGPAEINSPTVAAPQFYR